MEIAFDEFPSAGYALTYFDSAGRSILPQSVEKAGVAAVKQKSNPWLGVGSDTDIHEVRSLFATLIGCHDPSCISINSSTGFAMTLVASNVVRMGLLSNEKKVLIMDKEMGSVVYPWQEACKATGASFNVVSDPFLSDSQKTWTEAIIEAIDASVAVLALPPVHWCSGAAIDLKLISQHIVMLPASTRPLLVVDGTQYIGAVPFDIRELAVTAVACSVHKWLNGPYGMSLLYVAPELHTSWLPLDHHERGRAGSNELGWDETIFMDKETGFYPDTPFPDARRFDSGGKANPVTIPMVRAGLETVLQWRPECIEQHCRSVTDALTEQLQSIFHSHLLLRPASHRTAHILGIRFNPLSPLYTTVPLVELNARLKACNVFASVRGEWLRVSVYIHNNIDQVHRFVSLFTHIAQDLYLGNTEDANNTRTVLVTGGSGWLSQFLSHALLPQCIPSFPDSNSSSSSGGSSSDSRSVSTQPLLRLHFAHRAVLLHWIPAAHRHCLDLCDVAAVDTLIQTLRPDVILHTAALSAPVVCHRDPLHAHAVNCPESLFRTVRTHVPDCLFVFTSTDMVYDGEHAPYAADECTAEPVNVYGETKLAFEHLVRKLRYGAVLRLSNMIGPAYQYQPVGCKFLEWLYGAYRRRECVGLKQREVRSFVYVQDVVAVVLGLLDNYLVDEKKGQLWGTDAAGSQGLVLNVGGPQALSRLDVARTLCQACNSRLVVQDGPSPTETAPSKAGSGASAEESGWEVYVMDTAEPPPTAPASSGLLQSPRDISMDSTHTTSLLQLTFTPVAEALVQCLPVLS